jgi:hypothetical protein
MLHEVCKEFRGDPLGLGAVRWIVLAEAAVGRADVEGDREFRSVAEDRQCELAWGLRACVLRGL